VANSQKRVCKNKEFKSRKIFTVFKTVNRFPKIKKDFTVKQKIISIDHYFHLNQPPENAENIFQKKIFYAETN
jgi:hypothetical protein